MTIKYISGATCACLAAVSLNANAVVLTFDDVPGGSVQNSVGDMPTYHGFNFSSNGTSFLDWIDLVGSPSWNFGAHSGDFGIFNNDGGIGTIIEKNGADFIFDGLWAKKWLTLPDSAGDDSIFGHISGYNNGNLVWDVVTGLNGSYEFYASQAGAIDELRLDFGGLFLVDDLALTAVPIPAAVWLFGSGLLGLIAVVWRKSYA